MTTASVPPQRSTPWSKLRLTTWRGRLMWVGGLFLLFLLTCWLLVRLTPSWYAPLDPSEPHVIDLSGRAQNLLAFELRTATQRVPLGEQTWTITQDEINSLLAIRTAAPLDAAGNRHPVIERISDPYIVFGQGTISVSARIKDIPSGNAQGGVGTLIFSLAISDNDGQHMGQVKLIGVRAGDLPVPSSLIENRLHDSVPGVVEAVEKLMEVQLNGKDVTVLEEAMRSAGQGRPFPLEYRIDKKDLIIKDMRVETGRFTLVLVPPVKVPATVPAGPAGG